MVTAHAKLGRGAGKGSPAFMSLMCGHSWRNPRADVLTVQTGRDLEGAVGRDRACRGVPSAGGHTAGVVWGEHSHLPNTDSSTERSGGRNSRTPRAGVRPAGSSDRLFLCLKPTN